MTKQELKEVITYVLSRYGEEVSFDTGEEKRIDTKLMPELIDEMTEQILLINK